MLFEFGFNRAGNIGNAESQPIEEEQSQAGMILLEVATLSSFDAEDAVEPIKMIQVAGENSEDFEFEPAHFQDDRNETDGEKHAGRKAVNGVLAEGDGSVAKQECQSSDELRAIAKRMEGHGYRDEEHQSAIKRERAGVLRKNAHGIHVVNPEGAKEEQRPPATNTGAAEQAIPFVLLDINAAHKKKRGG